MIYLHILLVFGLFSCNDNCNDCGPISYGTYYLRNLSSSKLKMIFYGDATTNFSIDSINVPPNDRVEFLYVSTGSPIQSALKFKYYLCDSMKLYESIVFKSKYDDLNNCNVLNNPMCTSNYTMTKGDKYAEYELVIQ